MSFKQIIDEKRQWNQLTARIKLMPKEYQIVYKEIQKYIFKVAVLNPQQIIELFTNLIELFELGIVDQKQVLEITGSDVAEFCDQLIEDYDQFEEQIKHNIEKSINDFIK